MRRALAFPSRDEQQAAVATWLRRLYPSYRPGGCFYRHCLGRVITDDSVLLDAGCGRGGMIEDMTSVGAELIGVDIDQAALDVHPRLDRRICADLGRIPILDASVDVVASEFVFEHLADPDLVLRELNRVLEQHGAVVIITPNVLNPVMAMSKVLPLSVHRYLRRTLLHHGDAWPTYYRANTKSRLQRLGARNGFSTKVVRVGNPNYFGALRPLVPFAVALERLFDLPAIRFLKMYLVVEFRKVGPPLAG